MTDPIQSAIGLLLAAVSQMEDVRGYHCTEAHVEHMIEVVTERPGYTVPGVLGLVHRTCEQP